MKSGISLAPDPSADGVQRLADLQRGARATVSGVLEGDDPLAPVRLRLMELGFVPGESVQVMALAWPGGDPMSVRVGNSTFALRRHEAHWVQVRSDAQDSP